MMTENNLIVDAPLVWQIEAKTGREKNFRTYFQGGWNPVSIRRIGNVEAPVVASWFYMGGWSDERQVTGREIVRIHDNAFFRPYRGTGDRLANSQSDEDALNIWVNRTVQNPLLAKLESSLDFPLGVSLKQITHGTFVSANLDGAKETGNSSKDAALARLEKIAEDILIIDGKLWERCDEPVLALNHNGFFINPQRNAFNRQLTVSIVFNHEPPRQTEIFRLDDLDGIDAYLEFAFKQKARGEGNLNVTASRTLNFDNLDVALPQALTATPEVATLHSIAQKMLAELSENGITRGRAFANAWHDLKDAMDANIEDLDELCQLAINLSNAQGDTDPLQNFYYADAVPLVHQRISTRPTQSFANRKP
jgi:hypothetical protein